MSWIKTVPFKQATGKLKKIYQRVVGPNGNLDNILEVHSLRPHSLEGHMQIYKNVLHHSGNSFDKWFLETVGVYVSQLNNCDYCYQHHFSGLARLIANPERSNAIKNALKAECFANVFTKKETALLIYSKNLTLSPSTISEIQINTLKSHGINDGEILEINQVASYFAYANRTVLGLGVNTEGDILGLSPNDNDDPDNWSHN